jgi:flavodoxin
MWITFEKNFLIIVRGVGYMKKVLVVYYSRSGNTEKAALKLANSLNADVEKLVDYKKREGILGFIIGGRDAVSKKLTMIEPVKSNTANYDLVIVATPTWASTMAPAIRTYIHQRKDELKQVAFLVTQGGGCNGKVFEDLKESCGISPIVTLDLGAKQFKENTWGNKIDDFIAKVR